MIESAEEGEEGAPEKVRAKKKKQQRGEDARWQDGKKEGPNEHLTFSGKDILLPRSLT